MSIARLSRKLCWLVALLSGCVSGSLAAVPCEFSKTQSKIPVLVTAGDAAVAERLAGELLRKLQHATPRPPIELKAAGVGFTTMETRGPGVYTAARAAVDTEALRDLGIKERAALVLWRDKSAWVAVVVRAQSESVLGFPVPKSTRLPAKRIASFLQAFAHYYYGDVECALNGFTKLEAGQPGNPEAAAMTFWTTSTLARLGQNDKAISRFRVIISSLTSSDAEARGSFDLALGLLLLPRAAQDQYESREVLNLLEEAARVFNQKDGRNWAASQIALGRYWLLTSGRTSAEGLLMAQRHFDQAEPMLVFPYDAAEWANLQSLMGMTQLQLGFAVKDSGEHFASAADHFQAARVVWTKIGDEVQAEALSHQLRYTSELRSRMR